MILSTGILPDFHIDIVLGVVTGSSIRGSYFLKDIMSKVTDAFGGKARGYEEDFEKAQEEAIRKLTENADRIGADAVMGIDLDVSYVPKGKGGLYIVSAVGTAFRGSWNGHRAPLYQG
ncbi:MAG: heavy metal-binding domain-containing protein [Deltaproteobacteria bacterium]|jgi:uncharacterized protein YbjQ (UPF0145 family)